MDLGALLLTLGIALLVGVYVAQPLLRPSAAAQAQADREAERSVWLARRDTIVAALEDLDMDFELGKITEAAYRAQKKALLKKGAEVLEHLDALSDTVSAQSAEERLEAAARARRKARRPVHPDDEIEALLEQRRRQRQQQAVGFCPKCGAPVLKTDRFCPKCGTPLQ